MSPTFKLVYIEWIDSKGVTSRWEYLDDLEPLKPCICKSIGYLIDDNKDYKTIAQTLSDTQLVGKMSIPTKAIIRIRKGDSISNCPKKSDSSKKSS